MSFRLPQQATATMSGNTRQQLLTTLLPTVSSGQQQQLATAQPANAVAMLASTQPQALTSKFPLTVYTFILLVPICYKDKNTTTFY